MKIPLSEPKQRALREHAERVRHHEERANEIMRIAIEEGGGNVNGKWSIVDGGTALESQESATPPPPPKVEPMVRRRGGKR